MRIWYDTRDENNNHVRLETEMETVDPRVVLRSLAAMKLPCLYGWGVVPETMPTHSCIWCGPALPGPCNHFH